MTDWNDFEEAIRAGMHESTEDVVAGEELQHRLVTAAASGRREAAVRTSFFHAAWALPAAAAVITALAVGSVVLVSHDGGTSGAVSGNGTAIAVVSESAAPTTAGTTSAATTTATTAARTAATTTAPVRHSSAADTTSSAPTSAPSTAAPRSATSSQPEPNGVPPTCSTPAGGTANPTTLAEFTSRVTRTWLVCASPSIFGTTDAGLQISSDGSWAKLVRDTTGRLVKGTGLHDSGTWKALDDSAMNGRPAFQLNLVTGNGTIILQADFAAAVDRVQFDNNGVYVADYVPTSESVG
jgi:hypothetical protein